MTVNRYGDSSLDSVLTNFVLAVGVNTVGAVLSGNLVALVIANNEGEFLEGCVLDSLSCSELKLGARNLVNIPVFGLRFGLFS